MSLMNITIKYSPNCFFLKETFLSTKSSSKVLSPYFNIEKTNQYALEMENIVIMSRDSLTSQLPSKSETLSGEEVKLPPSMKLRCSSKSPVDDGQEEQSQGYAIHPVGDNTN